MTFGRRRYRAEGTWPVVSAILQIALVLKPNPLQMIIERLYEAGR